MPKLKQFVAATYEVRPVEWKPGWNVRDGLAFSHIYDPLAKPDSGLSDQEWYKAAIPLRGQLTLHRALEAQAQSASTRIAGLAEGVVLRGDWRQSARRARTTAEASAREGLLTELSRFGVNAAPPLAREATPFSNSPASEDARGRYDTENKKLEAEIDKRSKALERRLLTDVPAIKPHLGQHKRGCCRRFPMTAISPRARSSCPISWRGSGAGRWTAIPSGSCSSSPSRAAAPSARARSSARRPEEGRGARHQPVEGPGGLSGEASTAPPRSRRASSRSCSSGATWWSPQSRTRTIGVYDIKAAKKLAIIADLPQADLLEDALLSVDGRHVIQLNSDGQFFLHEIDTGRMALSGRYVDGEIILYTPEAYYWSSYEGAHFVQLRFPGLPGLYSFQQFAAVLNRPEVIQARIAGGTAVTPPRLVPPPVVEARLVEGPGAGGGRRVRVQARSGEGLARLRLYQDGQLIDDKSMSGPQFQDEITLPADRQCAVDHGSRHRQRRSGLGSAVAAARAGAGRPRPPPRRAGRRRHLCRAAPQAHLCQVGCAAPRGRPEVQHRALLRGGEPAAAARRRGDSRPRSPRRSRGSSPPQSRTTPSSSRSPAMA